MKKNIVSILCIWVIIVLASLCYIHDCKKSIPCAASSSKEQQVTNLNKSWSAESVTLQTNENRIAD